MKIVNLKDGMPTIEQARARLTTELARARQEGEPILKLIHGYGSHRVGGELRIALQASLAILAREGQIAAFIPGEDWRISNQETWDLLKKDPKLKQDPDLGRGNKGISVVVL